MTDTQSNLAYLWYQDDEDSFLQSTIPNGLKIFGGIAVGYLFKTPIRKLLITTLMSESGAKAAAKKASAETRSIGRAVSDKLNDRSSSTRRSSSNTSDRGLAV